jgi:hypothetical protein
LRQYLASFRGTRNWVLGMRKSGYGRGRNDGAGGADFLTRVTGLGLSEEQNGAGGADFLTRVTGLGLSEEQRGIGRTAAPGGVRRRAAGSTRRHLVRPATRNLESARGRTRSGIQGGDSWTVIVRSERRTVGAGFQSYDNSWSCPAPVPTPRSPCAV